MLVDMWSDVCSDVVYGVNELHHSQSKSFKGPLLKIKKCCPLLAGQSSSPQKSPGSYLFILKPS